MHCLCLAVAWCDASYSLGCILLNTLLARILFILPAQGFVIVRSGVSGLLWHQHEQVKSRSSITYWEGN